MADRERLAEALSEFWELVSQGRAVEPGDFLDRYKGLEKDLRPHLEAVLDLTEACGSTPVPPLQPPPEMGDYRLREEISRGGMGAVYLAEQLSVKRLVALKVIPIRVTENRLVLERFCQEAQAAGLQNHTNIVAIYGMGNQDSFLYYSMEYLPGPTLKEVLARLQEEEGLPHAGTSLPLPAGVRRPTAAEGGQPACRGTFFRHLAGLFAGVADALGAAGEKGIVHRDIKPANLIFDGTGTLKIVDFGLARLETATAMTLPGTVLGTPVYMSPEQARGRSEAIDHRADLYSLGATLYELLTGEVPYPGETMEEVLARIASHQLRPVQSLNRQVPADLAAIVEKTLERNPDRRYPSGRELAQDLHHFALGKLVQAPRLGPVRRLMRRLWHHRARIATGLSLLVLTGLVVLLASWVGKERQRRRTLEYNRLVRAGQQVLGWSVTRAYQTGTEEGAPTPDTAGAYFDKAIALAPDRPQAYWLRLFTPGRTEADQLADVKAALERGLPRRTYHLLRSLIFCTPGARPKLFQAYEEWATAEALTGESVIDLYAQSRILHRFARHEESRRAIDRAIDRAQPAGAVDYLARRFRSELCLAAGDHQGAMRDLMVIRSQGDRRPETTIRLASLWKRLERPDVADKLLEEALTAARDGGNQAAWESLYWGCRHTGELPWLERVAREGANRHPRSLHLLHGLHLTGQHALAVPHLLALVQHRPDDPRARLLHGVALQQLDLKAATGALRRAVEMAPDCRYASHHLARNLEGLGRLDDAIRWTRNHLHLHPGSVQGHLDLLHLYRRKGGTDPRILRLGRALATRLGREEAGRPEPELSPFFSGLSAHRPPDWPRSGWLLQSPLDPTTFLPFDIALAYWDRLRRGSQDRTTEKGHLLVLGRIPGNTTLVSMRWDGHRWIPVADPNPPPARSSQAVTGGWKSGRTVLFSGWDGRDYLDDTWSTDGAAWRKERPRTLPPPRDHHALASLGEAGGALLFGGWAWTDKTLFADTWSWAEGNWTRLATPVHPPGRDGHAMAWDPVRKEVVLFGGGRSPIPGPARDDTWLFRVETGSWRRATDGPAPPPRFNHALVWDPVRRVVLLLGGRDKARRVLSDCWAWDGRRWTRE